MSNETIGNPIDGLILSSIREAEGLADKIVKTVVMRQTIERADLERIQLVLRAMAHLVETLREQNQDLMDRVSDITIKYDQARGAT